MMFNLNTLCLVLKNILKNNEVYNMKDNGFVRVGALVNKLYLGNVIDNAKEISKEIKKAYKSGISILVSPELSLTGYTCGDMFLQDKLILEENHLNS